MGMTEVLRTVREGQMENDVVGTNSSHSSFKCLEYSGIERIEYSRHEK